MLASAPAGTLDGWIEYYRKEPFGEPWRQMSSGACLITNEIRGVQAGITGSKPEWLEADDLVPGANNDKPDEAIAAIESMEW